jgi:hypothetical protein
MFITERQKSIIKSMESKLGICFSGVDRKQASKFIHQNIKALRKLNEKIGRVNMPTGRQMRYIKKVEKKDGIKFDGETFQDAYDYIAEHKLSEVGIY